jgi:hypothetical protein
MSPSEYILASAMFDENTRVKLLSVNHKWFESPIDKAIAKIQELYLAHLSL